LTGKFNKSRSTKSTKPTPDQEVTLQTLHRRFAHAGNTATKHIPAATQGIELAAAELATPEYEVCHLAKDKKIIKRAPSDYLSNSADSIQVDHNC
jgi:hypothetical protein